MIEVGGVPVWAIIVSTIAIVACVVIALNGPWTSA